MTKHGSRQKRTRLWLLVGVVLGIGLLAWRLGAARRDVAMARKMLNLAPLPADATDVHAASIHSWTWVSAFVRFTASPASVEAFLAASPGLTRVKAEAFTPTHQYLPYPGSGDYQDLDAYAKNTYFSDYARIHHLPWFDRTITQAGRAYLIRHNSNDVNGEVVVDDARHVVYIYADKG